MTKYHLCNRQKNHYKRLIHAWNKRKCGNIPYDIITSVKIERELLLYDIQFFVQTPSKMLKNILVICFFVIIILYVVINNIYYIEATVKE
jgi:hypothetical protein